MRIEARGVLVSTQNTQKDAVTLQSPAKGSMAGALLCKRATQKIQTSVFQPFNLICFSVVLSLHNYGLVKDQGGQEGGRE